MAVPPMYTDFGVGYPSSGGFDWDGGRYSYRGLSLYNKMFLKLELFFILSMP